MPLTRIDSKFLDIDGGIDFDVQNSVPTFKVEAVNHRVGIGHNSPAYKLDVVGDINISSGSNFLVAGSQISTANVAEDSSYLYYTNARVDARIALQDLDLSTKSTSDLAEGTNLYYTDARARSSISVTDSGGDGSLSYNSSTGVITFTGPDAASIRTHFSAGSGISITSGSIAVVDSIGLAGTPTAPTAAAGTNTTQIATTAFVSTGLANLVDSAPGALDTLNELAAALGDDANFSTTITNSIATKLPLAGGQMTGDITFSGTQTVDGRDLSADGTKLDGIESNATANQTAAEILTAIKTVDGTGSGLDADLLDGIQGVDIAKYNDYAAYSTVLEDSGFISYYNISSGIPAAGSNYWSGIQSVLYDDKKYGWQLVGQSRNNYTEDLYVRKINNNTYGSWSRIWTAASDGSGSGLDADLLDGQQGSYYLNYNNLTNVPSGTDNADTVDNLHASSFLRSDAADTATGPIAWNGTLSTFDPPGGGTGTDTATDVAIGLGAGHRIAGWFNGYIRTLFEWNQGADITIGQGSTSMIGGINLVPGTSGLAKVNGNTIWHAGNDGSGSGLDADTVDGIDSGSFLRADQSDTSTATYTFANTSTTIKLDCSGHAGASNYNYFLRANNDTGSKAVHFVNGSTRSADGGPSVYTIRNDGGSLRLGKSSYSTLLVGSGDLTYNANKVWHAGNDGSGSGLDADTVDGIQGANFLRSDIADSAVGKINFNANNTNNWDTIATSSGSQGSLEVYNSGSGNDAFMAFHAGGDYAFYFGLDATTNDLSVGGWSMGANKYRVWHAGNDGSGSGLDADLLDGVQGTSITQSLARFSGWVPTYTTSSESAVTWNYTENTVEIKDPSGDASIGAAYKAVKLKSGDKVRINVQAKGSVADTDGFYLRLYFYNGTSLPNGKTHVSHNATHSLVQEDSSSDTGWHENSSISTSYVSYSRDYTAAADGYLSIVILNWTGYTGSIYVKEPIIHFENNAVDGIAGSAIWHSGNDGAGSGLDADHLDGYTWASSGKNVRATEFYADNWFRNYNSGEGLYNEATGCHIVSDANEQWTIRDSGNSIRLNFKTNGSTQRASVYADNTPSIGFLNSGNQWGLRYLSNDGNSPNLYFREEANETWTGNPGSDMGKIEYHSNRFYVAAGSNSTYVCQFRRGGSDIARVENDGKIYAQGSNLVWHAGNDGSGSGLDADTLDGLQLAGASRNNVANQVVRTQANGYINAGWINTTSGSHNNTVTKVYSTYTTDGYIRYCTPNHLATSITSFGDVKLAAGKHLMRSDHHSGHLEGSYNNVGANSYKSNPIYTIGSSYNPSDAALGNMYGIGYTNTNASFISLTGASGWGMYAAADGDARVFLCGSNGAISATGNITAYASDGRLKTNVESISNPIEKIKKIRGVTFDWVDNITSEYDFHPSSKHETGVIAQEIQEVVPDAVVTAPFNGNYTAKSGTDHNFLTVDKEKIIPLLIEAIKDQQKQIDELKAKLEKK